MTDREDRLQVRVEPVAKKRLKEAADELGMTLSAFVLLAAQRQASDVLAERSAIRLSPAAAEAFEEALQRPAQVNERLRAALARPTKFTWLD